MGLSHPTLDIQDIPIPKIPMGNPTQGIIDPQLKKLLRHQFMNICLLQGLEKKIFPVNSGKWRKLFCTVLIKVVFFENSKI